MDELRENCPWDKKQTLESLRHLTIEETYELSDAILDGNLVEIKKELGDLMLHNVFYARIASEKKAFDMADVLDSICDKLIERHPHVYAGAVAENEDAVKANWERLKLKHGNKSVLEGVPASLPALVKAMRIQDKARGIGFDWEHKGQVWEKIEEEMRRKGRGTPDDAGMLFPNPHARPDCHCPMSVQQKKNIPAKATPITVVDANRYQALLPTLPRSAAAWLETLGFRGLADSHALVPDADGALAQVLAGNTAAMAAASISSFFGVAVPCRLM